MCTVYGVSCFATICSEERKDPPPPKKKNSLAVIGEFISYQPTTEVLKKSQYFWAALSFSILASQHRVVCPGTSALLYSTCWAKTFSRRQSDNKQKTMKQMTWTQVWMFLLLGFFFGFDNGRFSRFNYTYLRTYNTERRDIAH